MQLKLLDDDVAELTRSYLANQLPEKAIESAKYARIVLGEILSVVKPGVRESEIRNYAQAVFTRHGITRTWHQPYVRFAGHTVLTFKEKTNDDYVLKEDDIAFVDLGIVKNNIEGDIGQTMVFGDNKEYNRLKQASEAIFHEARAFWLDRNPTGIQLYDYIHGLADKMDVLFNLDPAGHLIGAFPHRGWKKGINHYPETIARGCWILEIQVCNKRREYGAFYEDLLY